MAVAAVTFLLSLLFRVNALYMFISVISGELLVRYVGDDAGLAIGSIIKGQNGPMIAQLLLLFLPVVLALLLLRHTMAKSKVLLHIVPLVGIVVTLMIFIVPLLASSAQRVLLDNQIVNNIVRAQDLIIAATCVSVLGLMFATGRHHEAKHGKHHHK